MAQPKNRNSWPTQKFNIWSATIQVRRAQAYQLCHRLKVGAKTPLREAIISAQSKEKPRKVSNKNEVIGDLDKKAIKTAHRKKHRHNGTKEAMIRRRKCCRQREATNSQFPFLHFCCPANAYFDTENCFEKEQINAA